MKNIIHKSVPNDAPTNNNPVTSPAWVEWIENARNSTDHVILIQVIPYMRASLITYPFLSEYRPQIERGEMYWFSLAELLALDSALQPKLLGLVESDLSSAAKINQAIKNIEQALTVLKS